MIGIAGIRVGILRCHAAQPARHAQQIGDANGIPGVLGILPFLDGSALPEIIGTLLEQPCHQRRGDAFTHGPAGQPRPVVHSLSIAFGYQLAFVSNGKTRGERKLWIFECRFYSILEL